MTEVTSLLVPWGLGWVGIWIAYRVVLRRIERDHRRKMAAILAHHEAEVRRIMAS